MTKQVNKEFLNEKIKASEYFDNYIIGLLLKYGFEFNRKKKYYTQSEINETADLVEKLQEVEKWQSEYLTFKQCGLLIKHGCYQNLRAFLINGFTSIEYNSLKMKLNEIYIQQGKEIKQPKQEQEEDYKPKRRKPRVNDKKIEAVYQFIQSHGGLNELEVRELISKIGYNYEGTLTEKDDVLGI